MPQPRIELRNVSKTFVGDGRSVPALRDVSLKVMPGEFVTIVGASGSGKSTLFNLCVGLLEPDEGSILVDGDEPESRLGMLGYMPQRDLLLPWRSVLDNVLVPQDIRGVPRKESRPGALALFPRFGLEGFENAYPSSLSGGMRQRAALLRTWLTGCDTLLLDEPFGALDALTRERLQQELKQIWEATGKSIVFVTHSVQEAVFLSTRAVVLSPRPGRVVYNKQIDLPIQTDTVSEALLMPEFAALRAEIGAKIGQTS
jgi:ABC-type nitrate/sulfonate/bicarbonate transport system ATPase subunit